MIARGIVGDRGGIPKIASPIFKQSFDLRTGQCLDDADIRIPSYPTRVRDGRVAVCVAPELHSKHGSRSRCNKHLTNDRALRNASAGRSRCSDQTSNAASTEDVMTIDSFRFLRLAVLSGAPTIALATPARAEEPPAPAPVPAATDSAAAAAQVAARGHGDHHGDARHACGADAAAAALFAALAAASGRRRSTCCAPTPPSRSTTTASGATGSTVATMFLASYKVTPSLAPMVRLGVSQNDAPGGGRRRHGVRQSDRGRDVREEGRLHPLGGVPGRDHPGRPGRRQHARRRRGGRQRGGHPRALRDGQRDVRGQLLHRDRGRRRRLRRSQADRAAGSDAAAAVPRARRERAVRHRFGAHQLDGRTARRLLHRPDAVAGRRAPLPALAVDADAADDGQRRTSPTPPWTR